MVWSIRQQETVSILTTRTSASVKMSESGQCHRRQRVSLRRQLSPLDVICLSCRVMNLTRGRSSESKRNEAGGDPACMRDPCVFGFVQHAELCDLIQILYATDSSEICVRKYNAFRNSISHLCASRSRHSSSSIAIMITSCHPPSNHTALRSLPSSTNPLI